MARMHDCPNCTCGLTRLDWSDRVVYVGDPEELAGAVVSCVLDHSYDRPEDGVPRGLPDSTRRPLAEVVSRVVSAIDPSWRDRTIPPDLIGRVTAALKPALLAAIAAIPNAL